MKTAPAVSVAMATYNGAQFIGEQLQSLARQTVLPAELVITDDCSTDKTLSIVAAFAAKAPFTVRIEKNDERLGYRANFMKATALCRSEFIAFSDQDDVWLPHKLEACLAVAGNNEDILLVYHNATVVTAALEPYDSLNSQAAPYAINGPLSLDPWHFGLGFTLMIRRALLAFDHEWLESNDYYQMNTREGHDQWYFFLAASLGSIGYVKRPLALHRQHGNNTFGWRTDARPRLLRLWANMMSTVAAGFKARELSSRKRAAILDRIGKNLGGERARNASLAAASYWKLEVIYRLRREMYLKGNLFSRLGRLAAMAPLCGFWTGKVRGIDFKVFTRDLVRGAIFSIEKRAADTDELPKQKDRPEAVSPKPE